ncbi:MAG: ABC-F family ATP-binding cassette domain-containing protein [Myxococcota bacterium]|nr:ABC-F family ATP-binding cassette domain-containing protein [Myxococcota bacterium]
MIRLENVTLAPGGEDLLIDVDWQIRQNESVGLVGRNGTGKTTILRAIVGEQHTDDGRVVVRPGLSVGYLPQQAVSGSTETVWDEVRSRMWRIEEMRSRMEAAEEAVAAEKPGAAERLGDAIETFRIAGGFSQEEKIGEVLHGLGFAPEEWRRTCDTFSGGWQMRIALARLLLSEPDIALLDEPTNHLDMLARSWLAVFLARAPFTTVIVSHDRHLLDKVAQRIVEVRGRRLHEYAGNFTRFLSERQLRMSQHSVAYQRQQEEIAKLERFVERFGAKATKAAQARSRQNQLDKMDRIDAPERMRLPSFSLPPAPAGDFATITLRQTDLGWDDPLLTSVNLVLERGMRLAILGRNGCGKSTLLRTLAGSLKPLSGRRRVGDRIRIGVFSQDTAAELPPDQTALEHVSAVAPMTSPTQIRTTLGALGLSGDAALRDIGALSGGEKARVALSALTARPHNVLLLDEPTNHLDTETVEVLVRALKDFEGAMVLVTHDRYLVESLASHVMTIQDGTWELHMGVRPSDLEPVPSSGGSQKEKSTGAEAHRILKQRRSERQKRERRLAEVEAQVESLENELTEIDAALCEPNADYAALGTRRADRAADLNAAMEEWEALEEALGE